MRKNFIFWKLNLIDKKFNNEVISQQLFFKRVELPEAPNYVIKLNV